jgi:hypothetical protein
MRNNQHDSFCLTCKSKNTFLHSHSLVLFFFLWQVTYLFLRVAHMSATEACMSWICRPYCENPASDGIINCSNCYVGLLMTVSDTAGDHSHRNRSTATTDKHRGSAMRWCGVCLAVSGVRAVESRGLERKFSIRISGMCHLIESCAYCWRACSLF